MLTGIVALILPKAPEIYHATEAWRKEEMTIDLSPQALPAHFAQGQEVTDEDTMNIDDVEVPEEGKRRKNRIPDKGKPNTVETNDPETTSKNTVQMEMFKRSIIKVMIQIILKMNKMIIFMTISQILITQQVEDIDSQVDHQKKESY